MAGAVGAVDRWQYSIIGDTANTAARLESYGKDDPTLACDVGHCRVLISEATYRHLNGGYRASLVGALELKGKTRPVTVYRLDRSDERAERAEGNDDESKPI